MMTTQVRIRRKDKEKLQAIARQSGNSMQDILSEAIESFRRWLFILAANKQYGDLIKDRQALKAEQEVQELWESPLDDDMSEL